jgi:hypothetical protein
VAFFDSTRAVTPLAAGAGAAGAGGAAATGGGVAARVGGW